MGGTGLEREEGRYQKGGYFFRAGAVGVAVAVAVAVDEAKTPA